MQKLEMIKKRIYDIIEVSKGNDPASRMYDILMMVAVIVGLIPLTKKIETPYSFYIDLVTAFLFLFDYIIRLYTSDYKMGFKSIKSYIAYSFTPLAIIDFLCILPTLYLFIPSSGILNILRIVRVFRILKLLRYSSTMLVIAIMLRKVKRQLFAVLLLTLMYIIGSAMFVFQFEPDLFDSFFEAVYWSTISITTIGYGDIAPATTVGRFITMISALVGVAVIALPSGIITAAYMDEIKKKKSKLEL